MSCWALIPIKAPGLGKTRLATALDPDEREALVEAMFRHVLDVTRSSRRIKRVCVLGPPRANLGSGILRIDDAGPDLNGAISSALAAITAAGPDRIVIVPADLPGLTTEDLDRLATLPDNTMGIAPDRHRTGTNALSLPLPAGAWLPFAFGENSFSNHCNEAVNLSLTVETILSCGLEKDIDDPLDLADAVRLLRRVFIAGTNRRPRAQGRIRPA
ncbi:2-phospho-L-lactate guanylyltransferase [Novosphingobium sp. PhB165]|uniref:2-phospho-L-lactate guanylyltransferase n=1 Tax=Novosphingobium sp. PhB165 TaxID=2485105 RepID=UPI0010495863|nr:2-phospho-L-lactate guanylyltransferase [Novosphingobium sp. PhB165]TCM21777.1 2-phospho-L-lactate guanylyltransferase [Novosphingobium sp. PhB165]